MANPPERGTAEDLSDRVDDALQDFWQGDSAKLESLLGAEDAAMPRLGELLDGALDRCSVPVVGLSAESEIAGYTIIRQIGHGGMGVVYEARQQEPRRRVALKVLRGLHADEHQIKLFRREIQALARLAHPAIATIYEAGRSEDGQHFFAMELVDGVPLDEYVADRDVPRKERLELFLRICEAVQYAHEHGVIHRDLKPANVLVDVEGNLRILDFGLARVTDADVSVLTTAIENGQVLGTFAYMSPEQARGKPAEIGLQSDVYALGVMLYELLTGRLPHDLRVMSPSEAVRVICEESVCPPGDVERALRGDLETIVLTALEKDPSRRYQSVSDLSEDLRRYAAGDPILAKPPSSFYLIRKQLSKHRLRIAMAAMAVAFGVLALWVGSSGRDRSLQLARGRDLELQLARERQRIEGRFLALHTQYTLEMGRVEDWGRNADAIVAKHPNLPEALLVWAQARYLSGDHSMDLVIERLREERHLSHASWAIGELLVDIYRRSGNDAEADRLEAEVSPQIPEDAEACYLRTFATLDIEKATDYAEDAIERDPTHALAWQRLLYLCAQTGNVDRAQEAAQKLRDLENDPQSVACRRSDFDSNPHKWTRFEASLLARHGRFQEALEVYNRVVTSAPNDPDMLTDRACVLFAMQDYSSALRDYNRALELTAAGTETWILYERASVLWIMGHLKDAVASYERVLILRGHISYADARRFLVLRDHARRLQEEGRIEESEQAVQAAREVLADGLACSRPGGLQAKIFSCFAGDLAPAALVEFATTAEPRNEEHVCEAYYYAGETCLLTGRTSEARKWFGQCVATGLLFDPDSLSLDAMNEYHLAKWRLEQWDATADSSTGPEGG